MIVDRNSKKVIFSGTLEMGYNIEVWEYLPLMFKYVVFSHAHAITGLVRNDHN